MRVRAVILVFFWFSQMGWCAEDSLRDAAQLLDAGRSREAEGMLHRLLDHDPQNGEARQLLGDLFRKDGKGPEAEREYRRALDLGRRDPELFKSLATVQKWQRHYSAALSSYREALRLAPLDSEARDELEDLQYRRGLSLFGAVGSSETDFTEKGWQTELTYGGIDRVNATVGASYADKFFYTRQSNYGSAYFFLSPSRYIQVNLGQKRYNYPLATNPTPDANAYRNVPSIEVEVGGNLHPNLRASLAYEYFRPNFFFGPSFHANNHKLSGELSYQTSWKPLRLRLLTAVLRDPDPNGTVVDRVNRTVSVVYGTQYLVGGGANFSFPRFEAELLVLPNRDLDRSADYSFLGGFTVQVARHFKIKNGYIFDHYSTQSVFTRKTAHVYNAGFSWNATRWLELSAGGKTIRRPVRNDQVGYVAATFRVPLR